VGAYDPTMTLRAVAVLSILALGIAGCGGSTLSPTPGAPAASGIGSPATATPAPAASNSEATNSAEASVSTSPTSAAFALSSPAFSAGAAIPRKYSCDGAGVSPPLAWTGVPDGTAELALIVDDPDARGFVHWVAAGIPPSAAGLEEGATGSDAVPVEGRNGGGRNGWTGPCPPSGTHHYRFTLYGVSRPLGLRDGVTADEARNAARAVSLATAELTATYTRG
jgi:Raf kinase inhibitor-like YbhB/YbcL family protein